MAKIKTQRARERAYSKEGELADGKVVPYWPCYSLSAL